MYRRHAPRTSPVPLYYARLTVRRNRTISSSSPSWTNTSTRAPRPARIISPKPKASATSPVHSQRPILVPLKIASKSIRLQSAVLHPLSSSLALEFLLRDLPVQSFKRGGVVHEFAVQEVENLVDDVLNGLVKHVRQCRDDRESYVSSVTVQSRGKTYRAT